VGGKKRKERVTFILEGRSPTKQGKKRESLSRTVIADWGKEGKKRKDIGKNGLGGKKKGEEKGGNVSAFINCRVSEEKGKERGSRLSRRKREKKKKEKDNAFFHASRVLGREEERKINQQRGKGGKTQRIEDIHRPLKGKGERIPFRLSSGKKKEGGKKGFAIIARFYSSILMEGKGKGKEPGKSCPKRREKEKGEKAECPRGLACS